MKRVYLPKSGQEYLSKRTEVRFTPTQHKWLINQPNGLAETVRELVDSKMKDANAGDKDA
ncbi:hypothetical protein Q8W41_12945 [Vibrio splendidus]|uniref:hypothetical protein n=1 Tax=Vibrio splendidus TaxID=29497 RepID=UPI002732CDFC|nr:hypothetical protein [Vibrio splendidus]MDP2590399.1 hypothetical protein [Vibrio splendidus]